MTLRPGVNPSEVAASQGTSPQRIFGSALHGFSIDLPEAAAEALARDGRVRRVEADAEVRIVEEQSDPPWGLDRIDQRARELDRLYGTSATGRGVTVYVVDTGIRFSHADFEGRARAGYSYFGADGSDCHGHGTHVAGTVAGRGWGVAKDAEVVSVQVLTCYGSGSLEGVVAGLDWIAANAVRPAVVNMSLGGGASPTLDEAVGNVVAAGVPVVAAAGNSNVDACDVSPARAPSAFTVGATDTADRRASWSNWGGCLDGFAPGVAIESAGYESDESTATMSGTSMAAPHAAGALALLLEGRPDATPVELDQALKDAATRDAVGSARSVHDDLLFVGADDAEPEGSPPFADFDPTCVDLACDFVDASSDPDGDLATWAWDFGDGSGSSIQHPSHGYATGGSYQVTLVVEDARGARSTTSRQVVVEAPGTENLPPSAAFSYQCVDLACDFVDESQDEDGWIAGWEWDFGGGVQATSASPSHTFPEAGTYLVSLVVSDDQGASDSASESVRVTVAVGIQLEVVAEKVKGTHQPRLVWSGATGTDVEIRRTIELRSGQPEASAFVVANTGGYVDETSNRGGGRYTYQVCEVGTGLCSAGVTVDY